MNFSKPCLHQELEKVGDGEMMDHLRVEYPNQLKTAIGEVVMIRCGRCGEGCAVKRSLRYRSAWYIGDEKEGCKKEVRG